MLKIYDTECTKCFNVEEQYNERDTNFSPCSLCGGKMRRIFTKFTFKLVYDNKKDICSWGVDGYAKSRYWDDVKKAREEGQDVKSPSCKY